MAEHRVDILLTTRDNASVLRSTLQSVAQQTFVDYTCYVIDDASRDDTVTMIGREFPWVQLLQADAPSGPSRNRNLAAAAGTAPLIATLDDDVVLTPGWLQEMVDFLSSSPRIGAAGSQLRFHDTPDMLNSIGGCFSVSGIGQDLFFNVPVADVQVLIDCPLRIVFACSAAMIMRRSAFEDAGCFDPSYFYLAEDFDLGLRMNLRGYSIVYNPRAVAFHRYHTRANQMPDSFVNYLYYRNSLLTVLKTFRVPTCLRILRSLAHYLYHRVRSGGGTPLAHAVFRALAWNLVHLGSTWKARQSIQSHRAIDDNELLAINTRMLTLRSPKPLDDPPRPRLTLGAQLARRLAPPRFTSRFKRQLAVQDAEVRYVDNIIFQTTNICNAACKQCFVLDQLNHDVNKNLSLVEIEKFFTSLGRVRNIVLGGGEPFLRKDLDRLCAILARLSRPNLITIPTNGAYPAIIYSQVKTILEETPLRLKISLSLDGLPATHDAIRRVPGLYGKLVETYARLLWLHEVFYPRLSLQVNSTLFRDNHDQFLDTYTLARDAFGRADFMFETIRGHYAREGVETITDLEYERIVRMMRELRNPNLNHSLELHELALETLRQRTQVIPCNGGSNFVVLDFFGNLYPCEILPAFVNIRDIGYDFARVANNPAWRQVVRDIQNAKCHCTHMCFLASSLQESETKGPLQLRPWSDRPDKPGQ